MKRGEIYMKGIDNINVKKDYEDILD